LPEPLPRFAGGDCRKSPIKTNFKNDWRVRDDVETVTHTSVRNSGNLLDTVPGCIVYELTSEEVAASNGAYEKEDVKWVVPGVCLLRTPKLRDTITDEDGTVWTVGRTWFEKVDQTWELTCRDLIIVNDLQQLITIEVPRVSQDNALGKVYDAPWFAPPGNQDVPGRLQPIQADVADERGLHGLRVQYTAYVLRPLQVANANGEMGRLVCNGVYYEIKGYRHPEEIWSLMEIDVERVP
jgi:hypothetical protein